MPSIEAWLLLQEITCAVHVGMLSGLFVFFLSFCFFRVTHAAYGVSQARDPIQAVAAGLHYSHGRAGSEPCLQPTPQLMARLDP